MRTPEIELLGLFPSFNSERFGGVQASGREAWSAILSRLGEDRAQALYYRAGSSKVSVLVQALRTRKCAEVTLVWHLHLLKLLPFLQHSSSRVIVFLHGIEAWKAHDAVTRFVLRKVDVFLSNSDYTWRKFVACNPHFERVPHQTVHLGAASPLDGPARCVSQVPAVLMVGRLRRSENYKGHREMIEAWPLVLDRLPDAELWIAGGGDLLPDLERMARQRGLADRVRFCGEISEQEKRERIASCRCLALPSRGEGFGLVYLEAMRMGRPCLVSTQDAGREVVNPPEAGLAVDPQDPVQTAHAVLRLLTPGPEWERWSAQARSRYETHFTLGQFQQRLLSALFAH